MRTRLLVWLLLLSASLCVSRSQEPSAAAAPAPPSSASSPAAAPAAATAAQPSAQIPATAPAPTAANTIRRNVSIVVLDGVALDAKGNVVTDLKRSDFHITEDGEPQTIRNFEVPGATTPPPGTDIESTADLDRLAPRAPVNIILLDEFTTRFEDMAFGRYSLKKWLEKQPVRLEAPTMLVAVDLQKFTVLRDYTQDKDTLLNALDHHFATYPWQAHQYAWVAEQYSTAFNTLRRVAEATSGHIGHKNMIWIGRGLPTINLVNYPVDATRQIHTAVQLTLDELRDARVTLYTIDPAGVMVDPGMYGQAAQDFAPFGGDPDFEDLARATGGRGLHGRNDVDAQIGTAIRDNASLYTIAYTPTSGTGDRDKFRKISVTVDRPGVTFLTRKGYYPAMRPARLNADGQVGRRLGTELQSAATSNMAYDALGVIAQVHKDDVNTVRILLQSKGLTYFFTDGSKPRFARLIVLVTTFDKKNKQLDELGRTAVFDAPMSASARGALDLPVMLDFKLKPNAKATHARVVVRVDGSGHMGTADLQLTPGAVATSASADLSLLRKVAPAAGAPAATAAPPSAAKTPSSAAATPSDAATPAPSQPNPEPGTPKP
jgi:VWFA-related protein